MIRIKSTQNMTSQAQEESENGLGQTQEKQHIPASYSTYFGTKTMKPFDLIFNILASVSVGLHKCEHTNIRERERGVGGAKGFIPYLFLK